MAQNLAIIKAAETTNLVNVKRKEENQPKCLGKIKCPFCNHNLAVFHILNESNERGTWNTGNFERHLRKVHLKKKQNESIHENLDTSVDNKLEENLNNKLDKNLENFDENLENFDEYPIPVSKLAVGSVIEMKNAVRITSSNIVMSSIVNYSDTDDTEDDEERKIIFVEVPGTLHGVNIESYRESQSSATTSTMTCKPEYEVAKGTLFKNY